MKKEVFDIKVIGVTLTIKTGLPEVSGNHLYEVWKGNDLLFVVMPHTEDCDLPGWKLTQEYENNNIDKEFIYGVGDAIESHYL